MFTWPAQIRYFVYTLPTDMRKGYDGLTALVRNQMLCDPLSGDVFIFISKPRTHIKMLYFDGDGFVLFCKRLERGCYDMPLKTRHSSYEYKELQRNDVLLLLERIRMIDVRKKPRFAFTAAQQRQLQSSYKEQERLRETEQEIRGK